MAASCAAIPVPVSNVAALVLAASFANPRPRPEIERRLTPAIVGGLDPFVTGILAEASAFVDRSPAAGADHTPAT